MTHSVSDGPSAVAQGQPVMRAPNPAAAHGMIHAVQSLLYIIIVALFIITFAVQPFRIPSESMDPTLMVGDFLLVAKQQLPDPTGSFPYSSTAVKRGDVIVFHYPSDPSIHLVKRVIGMPGDRLRLHSSKVFINGRPLTEPYAVYRPGPADNYRDNFPRLDSPDPDVAASWWIQMRSLVDRGELVIPPRSFFVLGDNRNDSEDSRYWGCVPDSAIVGKPLLIYFSLNAGHHQPDDSTEVPAEHPATLHTVKRTKATTSATIANFARWDRTLRVVH